MYVQTQDVLLYESDLGLTHFLCFWVEIKLLANLASSLTLSHIPIPSLVILFMNFRDTNLWKDPKKAYENKTEHFILFFSSYKKPSTKERRWKIFKNFSACPNCLFFSHSILKFYCFSTHSFMSYEKDINLSYLVMRIFCTTMSSQHI